MSPACSSIGDRIVTDHYTCKLCFSHYSECECPSLHELRAWETIKDVPNVLGFVKRATASSYGAEYLVVITSFRDLNGAAFNPNHLIPGAEATIIDIGKSEALARWPAKWLFDKREKATQ